MSADSNPPTSPSEKKIQAHADEHGVNLDGMRKLDEILNDDTPIELTLQEFRPFAPLFRIESDITENQRKKLTRAYLPLISWGYRPVHVVAVDGEGQKHVILRLPRIFVQAMTPKSNEHGMLAAISAKTHDATDRQDYRAQALSAYMNSFLNSQDNDKIIDTIIDAREETDQILIDFVRSTTGEEVAPESTVSAPRDDAWEFEDDGS